MGLAMTTTTETSSAAAASIAPHLSLLECWVLSAVKKNGTATCDEVERITGLSHQTASARITALSRRGVLVPSGELRRTRSGRNACAWMVAL